jgi:hypothetical protein
MNRSTHNPVSVGGKMTPNKSLQPTAGVPATLNIISLFMVSFPLHHRRHRLWLSLGR